MAYTRSDLEDLLATALRAKTETTDVEFKDGRGGLPEAFWRPITAFSHNPNGGVIFFGISETEDSKVTGGLRIADLQERIVNYFSDWMVNVLPPEIHVHHVDATDEIEETDLVAVIVKPIPDGQKPCYYRKLGLPAGACIRVGNSNRPISEVQMRQFIRESNPFRYDHSIIPETSLEDLSTEKIKGYLEKSALKTGRPVRGIEITQEILVNIGILKEDDTTPEYPTTVAGFLIFSKEDPMSRFNFSRCQIRCVRYRGTNPTTPIIDQSDVKGTLDEQIDSAVAFILRNIPLEAKIVGTRRVEHYAYPEEAIREIIANAVIHRDYQITETYTQVTIFDDRIEVSNPGNLPPGITIDNLQENQFSRNEVIAKILKDLDYMEEFGRGIDIVYSTMRERGLPDPIFRDMAHRFQVTLMGPRFKELNQRQKDAWCLFQEGKWESITTREYAEYFKVSPATAAMDIADLVGKDLIKKHSVGKKVVYKIGH